MTRVCSPEVIHGSLARVLFEARLARAKFRVVHLRGIASR